MNYRTLNFIVVLLSTIHCFASELSTNNPGDQDENTPKSASTTTVQTLDKETRLFNSHPLPQSVAKKLTQPNFSEESFDTYCISNYSKLTQEQQKALQNQKKDPLSLILKTEDFFDDFNQQFSSQRIQDAIPQTMKLFSNTTQSSSQSHDSIHGLPYLKASPLIDLESSSKEHISMIRRQWVSEEFKKIHFSGNLSFDKNYLQYILLKDPAILLILHANDIKENYIHFKSFYRAYDALLHEYTEHDNLLPKLENCIQTSEELLCNYDSFIKIDHKKLKTEISRTIEEKTHDLKEKIRAKKIKVRRKMMEIATNLFTKMTLDVPKSMLYNSHIERLHNEFDTLTGHVNMLLTEKKRLEQAKIDLNHIATVPDSRFPLCLMLTYASTIGLNLPNNK